MYNWKDNKLSNSVTNKMHVTYPIVHQTTVQQNSWSVIIGSVQTEAVTI